MASPYRPVLLGLRVVVPKASCASDAIGSCHRRSNSGRNAVRIFPKRAHVGGGRVSEMTLFPVDGLEMGARFGRSGAIYCPPIGPSLSPPCSRSPGWPIGTGGAPSSLLVMISSSLALGRHVEPRVAFGSSGRPTVFGFKSLMMASFPNANPQGARMFRCSELKSRRLHLGIRRRALCQTIR